MNSPMSPELFSQRPIRSEYSGRRSSGGRVRLFLSGIALFVLIGGGVFAYSYFTSSYQQGEIPLVKADGPYKQRPEQPGGLDIPHQDMLVFEQIEKSDKDKASPVEHLLPPPEMPDIRAQTSANQTQQAVPSPVDVAQISASALAPASPVSPIEQPIKPFEPAKLPEPRQVPTTVQQQPVSPIAGSVPSTPVQTTVIQKQVEKPAPAAKVEAQKPATAAAHLPDEMFAANAKLEAKKQESSASAPVISGKQAQIQLAAANDQSAAQAMLTKFQTKYGSVLGTVKLRLVKAEVSGKGTYYRVQSPPLSEEGAKKLCAQFKQQNVTCLIAH